MTMAFGVLTPSGRLPGLDKHTPDATVLCIERGDPSRATIKALQSRHVQGTYRATAIAAVVRTSNPEIIVAARAVAAWSN